MVRFHTHLQCCLHPYAHKRCSLHAVATDSRRFFFLLSWGVGVRTNVCNWIPVVSMYLSLTSSQWKQHLTANLLRGKCLLPCHLSLFLVHPLLHIPSSSDGCFFEKVWTILSSLLFKFFCYIIICACMHPLFGCIWHLNRASLLCIVFQFVWVACHRQKLFPSCRSSKYEHACVIPALESFEDRHNFRIWFIFSLSLRLTLYRPCFTQACDSLSGFICFFEICLSC